MNTLPTIEQLDADLPLRVAFFNLAHRYQVHCHAQRDEEALRSRLAAFEAAMALTKPTSMLAGLTAEERVNYAARCYIQAEIIKLGEALLYQEAERIRRSVEELITKHSK